MNKTKQNQAGFTLAEIMITMAIAGVLLAVGMPSMREFIQNGRITAVTNELVGTLMVARSEAMRQVTTTCVCPTTTATAAIPACSASSNWESGWIAFSDFNSNCVIDGIAPTADTLLKVWDGSQYGGQMTVRNSDGTINAINQIRFNARGETQSVVVGVGMAGTFSISDDRPFGVLIPESVDSNGNVKRGAGVVLSIAGSARSTRRAAQIIYTAPP